MYVVPRSRRGTRKLARRLEQAARERGWTTLRLETGRGSRRRGPVPRAGYRPIAAFGGYVGARTPRTRCSSSGPLGPGLEPRIRISLPSGR